MSEPTDGPVEPEPEPESEPAPEADPAPEPEFTTAAKPPRNRLLVPLLITAGVAVVAIAAAATLGFAAADQASSASGLTADLSAQTERADHLSSELTTYKERETDLVAREGEVGVRSDALDAREEAISTQEALVEATTLKDGYAYTVGSSMQAGTYQANSASDRCYWSITTSGTNYDDIVQNDLGKRGVLTVTVAPGQDFQSHSCGDWVKVG